MLPRRKLAARLAPTITLLVSTAVVHPGAARSAVAGPVLTAVGDVNTCRNSNSDTATAALAAAVDGPIAILGDWVEGREPGEIDRCVDPAGWGALKSRVHPTPGDNGEYGRNPALEPPGADLLRPYHDYFASAAGRPEAAWYSYDVGTWHVVVLDTNCSDEEAKCPPDSAQMKWLEEDLASARARCLAVTTHHNIMEQDKTFNAMRTFLRPLLDAGVDLWVSGHRHTYRRYTKVDVMGRPDPGGIRHFVAGTGGHPLNVGKVVEDGVVEKSNGDSWGVLRLTLKPGGYDWDFTPVEGVPGATPFQDSGSDTCSTAPGQVDMNAAPPASQPPASQPPASQPPASQPPASQPPASQPPATQPPPGGTARPPGTGSPPPAGGPGAAGDTGYWMVDANGTVYGFGAAAHHGDPRPAGDTSIVDLEPTPSGEGYWAVDSGGSVAAHGDAAHHGSTTAGSLAPGEVVTSLSATPLGAGYWLFTDRGRVLGFGDAEPLGDMSAVRLNGPVLDSIPTPSGRGYYMVGADGGIFTFGDAVFAGSMGDTPLNAPVQSLVPGRGGAGYWLVGADGGIFAFGVPFRGSMGDTPLNRPVTGMVPFGDGYLMVATDGGIFNFSDRPFAGSLGDRPPAHPIVAVAVRERPWGQERKPFPPVPARQSPGGGTESSA